MKSKEEIEQLAERWLAETPIKEWGGVENGYIKGYSQCQEDMADKKYTEEDLRQAIERTYRYVDNDGWSLDYIKEDIINSLNK